MDPSKASIMDSFEQFFLLIIRFVYLLESPRRGCSNKYTKRMFSWTIIWKCQWKNTWSADFCADQNDVIMNFAVITNVIIKRVHSSIKSFFFLFSFCIKSSYYTFQSCLYCSGKSKTIKSCIPIKSISTKSSKLNIAMTEVLPDTLVLIYHRYNRVDFDHVLFISNSM